MTDERLRTVHAYTSSQSIVDGPSKRFRRGRAAANLVPATTGAAHATTRALPAYAGLFDGIAVEAPIPVGSIADITFVTSRKTTVGEVNRILTEEADTQRYAEVLGVSRDPLVSSDIIGDPRASIVDLDLTKVIDEGPGQGHELVRQRVGLRKSDGPRGGVGDQGRRPQTLAIFAERQLN